MFPEGVLEAAPKFHVMALRAAGPDQSAKVQQAVVRDHPNVSAIDLAIIMQTIDSVYSKASFVVEFIALNPANITRVVSGGHQLQSADTVASNLGEKVGCGNRSGAKSAGQAATDLDVVGQQVVEIVVDHGALYGQVSRPPRQGKISGAKNP